MVAIWKQDKFINIFGYFDFILGPLLTMELLCRFFEVTDWVGGSAQNVSFPKDLFLSKESK